MLPSMHAPAPGQETLGIEQVSPAERETPCIQPMAPDDLRAARDLISEGRLSLSVGLATPDDRSAVLGLISEAKEWLGTKGTDQWSTDWLDRDGRTRNDRVKCSLKEDKTWLVWFTLEGERIPVATVTIENSANRDIWAAADARAVYLSRLVTARSFSGLHIGTALIDWACTRAISRYGADLVRIDVWTDNCALHDYYKMRGFRSCGYCPDKKYPSRALFEKPTSELNGIGPKLITDSIGANPRYK
jgi:ribosomal protein S18 acetylase RimI-like enzyme